MMDLFRNTAPPGLKDLVGIDDSYGKGGYTGPGGRGWKIPHGS